MTDPATPGTAGAPGSPSTPGAPGTPTPPHAPTPPSSGSSHALGGLWAWCRSLGVTRSSDRWIGGVAGGIAHRLGVDPLLIRGVLVASVLLGGIGILFYAVAWALLPEPDGRIHAEQLLRGNFDQAVVGIGALLLLGIGPANWFSWSGWTGWRGNWSFSPFGTILVIAAVVWIFSRRSARRTTAQHTPRTDSSASFGSASAGTASAGAAGSTSPTTAEPTPPWGSPDLTPPPAPLVRDAGSYPTDGSPSHAEPSLDQLAENLNRDAAGATASAATAAERKAAEKAERKAAQKAAEKAAQEKKRRTGPGAATVATVVALVVLALATLALGNRVGWWEATPLAAVAISLALLGLGIVVCGLRGRRGGLLSTLAVFGLIAVPFASTGSSSDWASDQTTIVGDAVWAPTTVAAAEAGVRVGAGNAEVDLTALLNTLALEDETAAGTASGDPGGLSSGPVTIPITVAAGQAIVTVPEDVAVAADITVGLGNAEWDTAGAFGKISGPSDSRLVLVSGPDGATAADALVVLDVTVGLGNLTVQGVTP